MVNAYTTLKKPILFIYAGLLLLSPLTLFMFKPFQCIGYGIFFLLIGAVLFALVRFFEFKLGLDIEDSSNLNDENKVKFDELLNREVKSRLLFVNLFIATSIIVAVITIILKKPMILFSEIAVAILLFLFFQNQIGSENIPVLKRKYLEDNINDNLGVISKKPLDEDEDEE